MAVHLGEGNDDYEWWRENGAGSPPGEIYGHGGDDRIEGDIGNDFMDGGAGDDYLDGGWFVSDTGNDILWGGDGKDEIRGYGGDDILDGGHGEDRMLGGDGNDIIHADSGFDEAYGEAGNDTIYADGTGNGFDTLYGMDGDDTYYVAGSNVIFADAIHSPDNGSDVVFASVSFALGQDRAPGIETIILTGTGDTFAVGNDLGNVIWGNSGHNALSGGLGSDSMKGGGGNDTLDGGIGADLLEGGVGNDTYFVDTDLDQVRDPSSFGDYDRVLASATFRLHQDLALVDELRTTNEAGVAAIDLYGSKSANLIVGNAGKNTIDGRGGDDKVSGLGGNDMLLGSDGNDTLIGGGGGDALNGGVGFDTASYVTAPASLFAGLEEAGYNTGDAAGDSYSGIEGLRGSAFDDFLYGSSSDNVLFGDAGNDGLVGKGGADRFDGGAGNDTVFYDSSLAVRADLLAPASNTGDAAGDAYILIENLEGSSFNDILLGNDNANIIRGNHYPEPGGGKDVLFGRGGNDQLLGLGDKDRLDGGLGEDTLDGGAAADMMNGGAGNDTFFVDNAADQVVESAGQGFDTVIASVSYALAAGLQVEALRTLNPAATTAINLTGNAFGQTLTGNAAANRLDGKVGADTMAGGAGNDAYLVDNAGDAVNEFAGQGTDTVYVSVSYTLGAGSQVETLRTQLPAATTVINLAGNAFAQALVGNAAPNRLDGKGGADTMRGAAGADTYLVDNAGDVVVEAAGQGSDTAFTSVSYALAAGSQVETLRTLLPAATTAINLTGNEFANSVVGNAGSNQISGRLGNDTLTGAGGSDFFLFNTALNATSNVDRITDYNVAADAIRLEDAVFTQVGTAGMLAVAAFHKGVAAHDANDRIIYNSTTGALIYDANGNVAGGAVQFATLATNLALTNADFVVI